jgi:hypothetical protein
VSYLRVQVQIQEIYLYRECQSVLLTNIIIDTLSNAEGGDFDEDIGEDQVDVDRLDADVGVAFPLSWCIPCSRGSQYR